MTKSEYMKKLSYSLRRLPKEDFNQAIEVSRMDWRH